MVKLFRNFTLLSATLLLLSIGAKAQLAATATVNQNVSCNGGDDGEIQVDITTGSPNFTVELYYFISGFGNIPVGSVNVGGVPPQSVIFNKSTNVSWGFGLIAADGTTTEYRVRITSGDPFPFNNLLISPIAITEPTVLDFTGTTTLPDCDNLGSGTITIQANGGTAPYTIKYISGPTSFSDGNIAVDGGTVDFTSIAAGTYEVQIVDANSCTLNKNDIVVEAGPEAGTATPQTTCSDISNFDLFTGLSGNDSGGSWADDDATGALAGNIFNASAVGAGTYHFTYTVSVAGCVDDMETLTVNVTTAPNSGVAVAQSTCTDINNFDLYTALDGSQDAGGVWEDDDATGALSGADNSVFDASAVAGGVSYHFTYRVTATGCADATTQVTITVSTAPNSGVAVAQTTCSDINAFDLFTALDGSQDAGGAWEDDDATGALSGADNSVFDASAVVAGGASYHFTYRVTATGCADATTQVTITVTTAPNSGVAVAQSTCTDINNFDLYTALDGSQDAGGVWEDDDATGALSGADNSVFDASAVAGGVSYHFTYRVTAAGCADATTQVTITVSTAPNSGVAVAQTTCSDINAFDLFTALDGSQDAGGAWEDDDATGALSGADNSVFDASAVVAGGASYHFTYRVTATGCADATTQVTITVTTAPNSGVAVAQSTCTDINNFDLYTALDGSQDAGGVWEDDDATGALSGADNSVFDASAVAGGVSYHFTYRVTAAGCADATTQVTITVSTAPNSGVAVAQTTCSDINAFDLFTALDGSQDAGGAWEDDDATGALSGADNSVFDASAVVAGGASYHFTYRVTATGCADATTQVTITVTTAPNSGVAVAQSTCTDINNFDLYTALDGSQDAGGAWEDDDATGALSGADNSVFDASAVAGGVSYHFTYRVTAAGCADATTQVTITVSTAPNSGVAVAQTTCSDINAFDLFTALDGSQDAGGAWEDDDATGALSGADNSVFDASAVVAGGASYHFTYRVTATGCADATTQVTITVTTAPNSGVAVAQSTCTDINNFDLYTALDGSQDAGGAWEDDDATGALSGADNSVFDASAVAGGVSYHFTYRVTAAGCADATTQVTITVSTAPNSGVAVAQTTCSDINAFDLFTALDGSQDAGGAWEDDDATGALSGADNSVFDASAVVAGGASYHFTYRVTAAGCADATTQVTITVTTAPNSGVAVAQSTCTDINNFDLYTALDGSQDAGGVWEDDDATGALSGADNSVFDASAVAGGVSYHFTYRVTAAGCADATTQVTITVSTAPNSGVAVAQTTCSDINAFDLFTALDGSQDAGGAWEDDDATGALSGADNSVFDASAVVAGGASYHFTYRVTAAGCADATTQVTITVTTAPNSGVAVAQSTCTDINNFDLYTALDGSQDAGGAWEDDDATGALSGADNSVFDASAVAGGASYHFTYRVTAAGCADATTQVTITVSTAPNAGVATPQTTCPVDNAFDLFIGLTGNDAGGTWNDDDATGALSGSTFDASAVGVGVYNFTYTVTGVAPCIDDMVTLQVTVDAASLSPAPNGGVDLAQDACQDGGQPNLTANTTAGAIVRWYSDAGLTDKIYDDSGSGVPFTPNASQLDVSVVSPPSTQFFVTQETNCGESSPITFTVNVIAKPTAGTDFATGLCETDAPVDLDSYIGNLGGDAGGSWNDDDGSGALTGTMFDPTVSGSGAFDFTYTVTGTGACSGMNPTAVLTITVAPQPQDQAINETDQSICENATVSISLANSESGVTYELVLDGNLTGVSNLGDGSSNFVVGVLGVADGLTTVGSPHDITIQASLGGGCPTNLTDNVQVTVNANPIDQSINEATTSTQTICEAVGQQVTLTNSENGVEYEILLDGASISPTPITRVGDGNANLVVGTLTSSDGLLAGSSYTITVTATFGSCTIALSDQIDVDVQTVSSPPTDNNGTSPVVACQNGAAPVISVAGTSVKWYSDAALTMEVKPGSGSSLDTDGLIDTSVTGSTSFFATQDEGCGESAGTEIVISVENCSGCFTVTISKTDATCTDDDGSIQLTVGTMGVSPFDYEITDTSDNSKVTQNDQPNNSFTFADRHSGTYNYVVRDATGCEVTGSVDISFQETEVTATVEKVGDFACFGDPTGGTARITVEGGTAPIYQYKIGSGDWTDFTTGEVISGLPVGTDYSILVRDDVTDQCPYVETISISEPSAIQGEVQNISDTYPEQDVGSFEVVNISSDFPPYAVALEDGEGNVIFDFITVIEDRSGKYSYTFEQLPAGTYVAVIIDASGCEHSLAQVEVGTKTDVSIPNVFTPNNDGVNEAFIILNKTPNAKLVIVNRWGVEVYKSDDYQNDWRAEGLPDGIYFYTVSMDDVVRRGSIEVWRGGTKINN